VGQAGGGGASYTAEAEAIFAAFTTPPSAERKALIDAVVVALLSGPISGSNIWAKCDALQVYAAADSQAGRVDWKTPARVATLTNAPTFSADNGFTTNGTNNFIGTGFNPGDGGSYSFLQDSASFGIWSRTSAVVSASAAGWFDGTDGITMLPRGTGDFYGFRINQATGTLLTGSTDGSGFFLANRSGVSATEFYASGVAISESGATNADATSTARNNAELRVGSVTAASFSENQFAAMWAGGSLTVNEQSDLYNALAPYMASLWL
jgi:hypothetical protein